MMLRRFTLLFVGMILSSISAFTQVPSDADIRKIVNDAAEFAQHSPEPDPSELWTDVLVGA